MFDLYCSTLEIVLQGLVENLITPLIILKMLHIVYTLTLGQILHNLLPED